MEPAKAIPQWAPRVTQREIRRLYETDAKGIYDQDLIDEVGYGLLARCQSFISAFRAHRFPREYAEPHEPAPDERRWADRMQRQVRR